MSDQEEGPPEFTPLEVILCIGAGFIIRPLVDAIFDRHYFNALVAIVYLVWAYRRVVPRLPSISPLSRRRRSS